MADSMASMAEKALRIKPSDDLGSDYHTYGLVESVNADGSYQVRLDGAPCATRCANTCTVSAGDRALVLVKSDGKCAVVGRVGGTVSTGGPKGDPGAPGMDGSDATATDVQIDGTSITSNGVANVPKAGAGELGVVRVDRNGKNGISLGADGEAKVNPASDALITARSGVRPVTASNVDYAVKAAMCDGKGAAWTDAEQAEAKKRLGITEGASIWGCPSITDMGDIARDENAYWIFNTPDLEVIYPAPSDKKIPDGNDVAYAAGYIFYGLVDADSTKCRFEFC